MSGNIVSVDEKSLKSDLRELVRSGFTESKESWKEFLLWLRGRGLSGVRLVTGDKSLGLLGALEEVFPDAKYQRCTEHFYRNVFGKVPRQKKVKVAKILKAIHAQESREASEAKAAEVADALEAMKLGAAAKVVREGCARRWPTPISRCSIGPGSGPTTPSSASTGKYAAAPAWLAPFPTGNRP